MAEAADNRGSSREEIVIVDFECGEVDDDAAPAPAVQRQDSLYVAATRAAGADHHGQDGWARTVRLALQCVGILYGDIGTSPLFVYSSTFRDGVGHPDDLLGALSLVIYSFLLFTVVKYVYIALRANDDGDGQ
jgi:KUP system potassium uptake protein